MVTFKHTADIRQDKAMAAGVYILLKEVEGEFVPPLHARNSTTQRRLNTTVFTEDEQAENLISYFNAMAEQSFILAIDSGKVVGFLSYKSQYPMMMDGNSVPTTYISTIAVKDSYRGNGIGSQMYKALFEKEGTSGLYSTRTWATNRWHRRILEKLGFHILHELDEGRIDADGSPVPTLYYVK